MARFVEFETTIAEFDAADPYLLRNVRVLGVESRNGGGRKYRLDALRAAIPLFESEGVCCNHDYTAAERGRPRGYTERVGVLRNMRCDDVGLFGDLQLNPKMPMAEAIKWDYEHGTKKVGLSWIGDGDQDPLTKDVVKINKVFSVDVVNKPATTTTFREAEEGDGGPSYGDTEATMLTAHEKRLGEHDTKLADHDAKLAEKETERAKSEAELQATVKNLLAEVEQLKGASKPKGVHNHPQLTPAQTDLNAFVASIQRKR
ncbi:MAG TPA: hypothetical protein VHX65_16885 [Pirellulales bacterium]|jgi:hypothetical protein|nr:hypothetical protein [Pirellulales bacterium]